MFLNSGSEAIDGALKLARRVTGRPGIIAFRGGFHGRTFGATSVTSSSVNYRTGYEPLLPGVHLTTFPAVYRGFGGDEAAAVAGAMADLRTLTATDIPPRRSPASSSSRSRARAASPRPRPRSCASCGRSATSTGSCSSPTRSSPATAGPAGCGRSSTPGSCRTSWSLAKAIANGLPLSAIVSSRELQERWGRGAHGSTFGGNPVACAAGIAVLETIRDERLVENAVARGAELRAGLERIAAEDDRIGDIRGPGLMIGVEFVRDRATREPDGVLPDA